MQKKFRNASDVVLNNMNMSQLDDSSEMLNTLAKIMDQFDIDEIEGESGTVWKIIWKYEKTAG